MTRTTGPRAAKRAWQSAVLALAVTLLIGSPALAWMDLGADLDGPPGGRGIHIADGSYVMNKGELQVNIMNWGYIGSAFSSNSTFSDAPSAQWPAGSGDEYLWIAELWVGGVMLGETLVSTDGEWRPHDNIEDTIYEAVGGRIIRPPGNEDAGGQRDQLDPEPDDDEDGLVDEEILNGYDDDEDGKIDEDFAQIGNQMMVLTNYDNTRLAQELRPDHTPLNLKVVQRSYAWENDNVDDFVGFEFTITNIGVTSIDDVYIGFFADSDIGPRGQPGLADDDMAGYWPRTGDRGMVKASDGSWVPISVGYMYDGAESNRLEGYFGILFLNHDTDPTGQSAPPTVGIRSFQSFTGNLSFQMGGDPRNDSERYILLSSDGKDQNTAPGKQSDFRFMVSAGPFKELQANASLNFQAAMVVGPGLDGLLKNCAEAALTYYGNFFDKLGDFESTSVPSVPVRSGYLGRETILCREDFAGGGGGDNPFDNFFLDFMDTTCVAQEWVLNQARVSPQDIFVVNDPDSPDYRKHCAFFNMDNCFECSRQVGRRCSAEGGEIADGLWNCNDEDTPEDQKAGCTGVDGAETQVNWLVGMAPPPPGMRLWPTDRAVHVYWNDTSEYANDARLNTIDFESYRLWRADNWQRPYGSSVENGPESGLWQMINEYDLINYYIDERTVGGRTYLDTLPLGRNTGLEAIRYQPVVLDSTRFPQFYGIWEPMRALVMSDSSGRFRDRPPLRDVNGDPVDAYRAALLPWESYPAVLDTFFWVIGRPANPELEIREKRPLSFYEYVDDDVHNGFIYFYSVTATDHEMDFRGGGGTYRIVGAGQAGDPGSSFTNTSPGAVAQTAEERAQEGANIYVYPNPATRAALADFQEMFPNENDPTGVRVVFSNLPEAVNKIKIWTLDGDLVQEIEHDGTSGYGQQPWNLISRNGQEIVSGIYLFTVESDDDRFEDFIGKFVVIR